MVKRVAILKKKLSKFERVAIILKKIKAEKETSFRGRTALHIPHWFEVLSAFLNLNKL